jgi:glutamate racemase
MHAHRVKALVVACNTATAAAVHLLRAEHPGLPVIGVEPALKPAMVASRTGRVGVLATRGTLRSAKFQALHAALANQAEFVLQPCDGLAAAIEANDTVRIATLCRDHMGALGRLGTAPGEIDAIVLGCTHYPFVASALQSHAPTAVRFFETGAPVARQTRHLLAAGEHLASAGPGHVTLWTSGAPGALDAAAERWLHGQAAPARRADVPLQLPA